MEYSSFYLFLKVLKINKKLRNFLDISLFLYQKIFILQKLKINFDGINIDKLIQLLNKEFKNFNNLNDKNNLVKIIEEIQNDKNNFYSQKNIIVAQNQEIKISLTKEIKWTKNENIIKLDIQQLYNIPEKQITIPSGVFPNLKVLYMNNKFIVPSSMVINLSELIINYCFSNKILFLNDINKEEIDLNNLLYLTIKSSPKKDGNHYYDNIKHNSNYKIKFHINNLQQFSIDTFSNDDNSFLISYFDLDIIYDASLNKKNKDLYKLKEQYYQFPSIMNSLNYLSIKNKIVINRDFNIIKNFEMKTFKTGLKHYWFNAEHFNGDAKICRIHYLEEKYEENKAKQKILKFYKNYFYFNDINIPKNNSLNVIKIRDRGRNLKASDINKIFGIKKNNYSVQEIYLNFNNKAEKYYYFLIKNIK